MRSGARHSLSGWLTRDLSDPLYRNAYALVANTVGTGLVGIVYWMLAAREYSPADVGRGSALISSMLLLSGLAQFNLVNVLPRFLPRAGVRSIPLILGSYSLGLAVSLLLAVLFVVIAPQVSTQWHFLGNSGLLAVGFCLSAVVWSVFALEDAVLTGLRRAVYVPIENTVYGFLKLGLLLVFAGWLKSTGIFASWSLPLVLIVLVINVVIFRRLLPVHARDGGAEPSLGDVWRFARVDYLGALFVYGYTAVPPLMVLTALGPVANGRFYVAWTLTLSLNLVSQNFSQPLLVEGSREPGRLPELLRGILRRTLLVVVPATLAVIVAAPLLLRAYGGEYARSVTGLLQLLAVPTVFRVVPVLMTSVDRARNRPGLAALTNLGIAVLVLGLLPVLVPVMGLTGVGVAWLVANLVVAAARAPELWRLASGRATTADGRASVVLPRRGAESPTAT